MTIADKRFNTITYREWLIGILAQGMVNEKSNNRYVADTSIRIADSIIRKLKMEQKLKAEDKND